MSAKRKAKKKVKQVPKLHSELQGFDIFLDEFGRIQTNQNLDHINSFLNRNLADRKLDEKAMKDEKAKKQSSTKSKK